MNWLQKTAMFAHGEGDYVIAYKSHVFLIDPTQQDTNDPIVRQMAEFLGTSTRDLVNKFSDTWEYLSHLRDMRPDILQGQIWEGSLLLQVGDFQHGAGSRLLQNVLKTLGISNVEYQNESNENDNTLGDWQVTGNLPEFLYHGTTSEYADRILRFGLQSGESTTNFPGRGPHNDISHDDTVFLVESIDTAMFYATNAVSEQHGFPVIFRFKIPDPNLLVSDFDVEVMSNQSEGNIYENTYKAPQDEHSTRIHEDPFDFSKKTGKFGYRGRIPANFIVDIMIRPEESEEYGYSESEWVSVTSQQLLQALEFGDPMSYAYEPEEEEEEEYMEPQEMPRRRASNWLTKQCTNVATSDMLEHAAKAITMTLPGSWKVIESRPNLKQTYDYQLYGSMTLYGSDVYQPGDEFIVKFKGFVKQSPSKMPDELYYLEDQAQQWLDQNHVPVTEFDSSAGHNMVYYHALVKGFIPGRNTENQSKQNDFSDRSPWPAKNPMHELGNTRSYGEYSDPIYTPFDLAEWVDTTIKRGYQDFDGDNGSDDPDMFPDWPYGEEEYTKEETEEQMATIRNPRIRGYVG